MNLEQLEQEGLAGKCSVNRFCAMVAGLFQVRSHEVAVLNRKEAKLQFAYPPELRSTGSIPMTSTSQVAKTATSKRAEIFNNFASVRHSSIFETIKLGSDGSPVIQKLMSAPVLGPAGETIGVIQICRKGSSGMTAGPDFGPADLTMLQNVAKIYSRVVNLLQENDGKAPEAANGTPVAGVGA